MEEPASPVFGVPNAREALFGHNLRSESVIDGEEQSQDETDLDEALITHISPVEDLKECNCS
jgi:hypothetical protein